MGVSSLYTLYIKYSIRCPFIIHYTFLLRILNGRLVLGLVVSSLYTFFTVSLQYTLTLYIIYTFLLLVLNGRLVAGVGCLFITYVYIIHYTLYVYILVLNGRLVRLGLGRANRVKPWLTMAGKPARKLFLKIHFKNCLLIAGWAKKRFRKNTKKCVLIGGTKKQLKNVSSSDETKNVVC